MLLLSIGYHAFRIELARAEAWGAQKAVVWARSQVSKQSVVYQPTDNILLTVKGCGGGCLLALHPSWYEIRIPYTIVLTPAPTGGVHA